MDRNTTRGKRQKTCSTSNVLKTYKKSCKCNCLSCLLAYEVKMKEITLTFIGGHENPAVMLLPSDHVDNPTLDWKRELLNLEGDGRWMASIKEIFFYKPFKNVPNTEFVYYLPVNPFNEIGLGLPIHTSLFRSGNYDSLDSVVNELNYQFSKITTFNDDGDNDVGDEIVELDRPEALLSEDNLRMFISPGRINNKYFYPLLSPKLCSLLLSISPTELLEKIKQHSQNFVEGSAPSLLEINTEHFNPAPFRYINVSTNFFQNRLQGLEIVKTLPYIPDEEKNYYYFKNLSLTDFQPMAIDEALQNTDRIVYVLTNEEKKPLHLFSPAYITVVYKKEILLDANCATKPDITALTKSLSPSERKSLPTEIEEKKEDTQLRGEEVRAKGAEKVPGPQPEIVVPFLPITPLEENQEAVKISLTKFGEKVEEAEQEKLKLLESGEVQPELIISSLPSLEENQEEVKVTPTEIGEKGKEVKDKKEEKEEKTLKLPSLLNSNDKKANKEKSIELGPIDKSVKIKKEEKKILKIETISFDDFEFD